MSSSGKTEPKKAWKVLKSSSLLSARPWIEVSCEEVELPGGKIIPDYYQIWITDYAMIYAETDAGEVILERQYKHGIRGETLSFPGGGIEDGEDPLLAAKRELLEETGYEAPHWVLLKKAEVQANYGCGHAYFFKATGAFKKSEPRHNDLEDISVELHKAGELPSLILLQASPLIDALAMLVLAQAV